MPKNSTAPSPTTCPECDGPLKAARVPTDAQFAAAFPPAGVEPQALPATFDTANPAFRAKEGALHRCLDCGYQLRIKAAGKGTDEGVD